jgi:hypothetical protein
LHTHLCRTQSTACRLTRRSTPIDVAMSHPNHRLPADELRNTTWRLVRRHTPMSHPNHRLPADELRNTTCGDWPADIPTYMSHQNHRRSADELRNTVDIWLGYAIWWAHPGAALDRFFDSLAVVDTWGDQPPSGVVGGGPRVTRRCPRRCGADLCPWPGRGGRFFPGGVPQR